MAEGFAAQLSENSGNLRTLLEEALKLYFRIEDATEPTSSDSVQADIRRGIQICEEATRMVSSAGIFSRNEGILDLPTADLQFLLLPVLLGRFTNQIVSRERTDLIRISEIYYRDFLQRTNDYGLSNYDFKDESENGEGKKKQQSFDAHKFRDMRVKQYSDKKKFQRLVTDLKKKLDGADDSTKREYYISLLKYFICIAIEELNFLETEKDILEKMKKVGSKPSKQDKHPPQQTREPVVITKEAVLRAVYGAGYPSQPTMTVQEFYDKRVHDGVFPDPTKPKSGPLSLQEASLAGLSLQDEKEKEEEDEENKIEKDDEEFLRRKRDDDEYKDDHRRGWGNRANRS